MPPLLTVPPEESPPDCAPPDASAPPLLVPPLLAVVPGSLEQAEKRAINPMTLALTLASSTRSNTLSSRR
jgi:hypothetical protein